MVQLYKPTNITLPFLLLRSGTLRFIRVLRMLSYFSTTIGNISVRFLFRVLFHSLFVLRPQKRSKQDRISCFYCSSISSMFGVVWRYRSQSNLLLRIVSCPHSQILRFMHTHMRVSQVRLCCSYFLAATIPQLARRQRQSDPPASSYCANKIISGSGVQTR